MASTLTPDARAHARETAESIRIQVAGRNLGEEWLGMLVEVVVRDNLLLPDMAVIRFSDPKGEKVDDSPLALGAELKIGFGAATDSSPSNLFAGEIVALEPEFREDGAILAARAFDKGHRLNRKKQSFTYIQKKAEDIVREVAGRNGLSVGDIDSTKVVHAHLQQSQETDWSLCSRLARMNGFEFGVWDDKLVFRKPTTGPPAVSLHWPSELFSFRPRASAVGQVDDVMVRSNDPKAKSQTTGQASAARPASTAPIWDQRAKAISALKGGSALVADRVATSAEEARSMAEASLRRNASTFLEAEGLALGSPLLAAGATVSISGVGAFSGDYVLGSTTHVFKGAQGYRTRFEITGDRPRAFADLVGGGQPAATGGGSSGSASAWSQSLVIATVTNNNDPEKMGRVKVKYPALGTNIESDWARVATPHAGAGRGLMFLPQPGDEVVVGFEHGDARRPFVLGSLFAGQKVLDDEELVDKASRDAMFAVKTPHQIAAHAAKEVKLTSDEKMTIVITGNPGDHTLTADGNVTTDAKKSIKAKASQSIELEASSSVKIKGSGTVEIESSGQLKVKGSAVSIEGSGMVEVKGGMIKLG
jgi:phage protein D/phage baseplate assembly protein gpV